MINNKGNKMGCVISNGLDEFIGTMNQGDIIMHHAHDFIANMIKALDKSNYNHCSIYDKDGYVYESVTGGVCRKHLSESICTQKTAAISIFRINHLPENKSILIEIIKEQHNSDVYAYDQIVLLAMILLKKKNGLDTLITNSITEKLLIYAANNLARLFDPNNKNEICSELIYRVYEQATHRTGNTDFQIVVNIETSIVPYIKNRNQLVKNAKSLLKNSKSLSFDLQSLKNLKGVQNVLSKKELESEFKKTLPKLTKRQQARRGIGARKLMLPRNTYSREFVRTKIKNWQQNIKYFENTAPETAKILKKIDVHNFITPADISKNCLNGKIINTFKTGIFSEKDCPICGL